MNKIKINCVQIFNFRQSDEHLPPSGGTPTVQKSARIAQSSSDRVARQCEEYVIKCSAILENVKSFLWKS